MKKAVAILLICALSLQCFLKAGIFGYYLANKDYIARVLCINKDRPEMKCEGKCHLKKQLEKEDEQERKLPAGFIGTTEISLFPSPHSLTILPAVTESSAVVFFSCLYEVLPGRVSSIFHPPQA